MFLRSRKPQRILRFVTGKTNHALTGKQQRFVAEYLVDGDGANAARRAGYASSSAKVTACGLLKRADIQHWIAVETGRIPNRALTDTYGTIADAQERREILSRIARGGKNPVAVIKAADVLNKMDGLYIQKHEVVSAVPLFMLPAGVVPGVSKED